MRKTMFEEDSKEMKDFFDGALAKAFELARVFQDDYENCKKCTEFYLDKHIEDGELMFAQETVDQVYAIYFQIVSKYKHRLKEFVKPDHMVTPDDYGLFTFLRTITEAAADKVAEFINAQIFSEFLKKDNLIN